jgi:hypothetical protein
MAACGAVPPVPLARVSVILYKIYAEEGAVYVDFTSTLRLRVTVGAIATQGSENGSSSAAVARLMADRKRDVVRPPLDGVITVEHGIHTIKFCGLTIPRLDVQTLDAQSLDVPIACGPSAERDCSPGAEKPHNQRRKPKRKRG